MGADTKRLDPVREAQAVAALRSSITALDADDQLLLDTIEGETALFEIIDALVLRMAETRGLAAGVDGMISTLQARKERLEKRAETDRALIEQALMIAELEKLERPGATLFLSRRAPKIEVQTEADIPAEFWEAQPPKLDRKALLAALKAGASVPGVCLSNAAPSLTVRIA